MTDCCCCCLGVDLPPSMVTKNETGQIIGKTEYAGACDCVGGGGGDWDAPEEGDETEFGGIRGRIKVWDPSRGGLVAMEWHPDDQTGGWYSISQLEKRQEPMGGQESGDWDEHRRGERRLVGRDQRRQSKRRHGHSIMTWHICGDLWQQSLLPFLQFWRRAVLLRVLLGVHLTYS